MAVDSRRRSVRSPSRVSHACMVQKGLALVGTGVLVEEFADLRDFADLLEQKNVVVVAVNSEAWAESFSNSVSRHTSRVVATVLEALKAVAERVDNVLAVLLNKVVNVTGKSGLSWAEIYAKMPHMTTARRRDELLLKN